MSIAPSFALATIMPFLIAPIIVVVFALIIWAAVVQTRKARENLQTLANRLGLTLQEPVSKGIFSSGERRVTGTFRNRAVQIYSFTTGSGKNRSTWCALSLRAATPPGFSLKIQGENFLTKAGRIFGVDDVETGDPEFDEKFYVKTKQPGYVRAALIPEVRMRFLDTWKQHRSLGWIAAEAGEVKYAEMGNFANASICDRFPVMLEIASDLAEIAEAYRE